MANRHNPFYPIIYVRGYAMTPSEIDDTTADPFCGFNLGSTVFRAVADKTKPPRKFVFESPVVRLASDFGYADVYEDGYDIMDREWEADSRNKLASRSIIIFRYYDEASQILGLGKVPSIEEFGAKLGDLILRIRDLVCKNRENRVAPEDFRCYLVAHSMGGLVCRTLLQNAKIDTNNATQYVDKFFTYATPHNGIEIGGLNVPAWLTKSDLNNFNRDRMAEYLDLKDAYEKNKSVDLLPEDRFSSERVFCMVGTNRLDYGAAFGLSRTFAGHGSDGLVKIENATLRGLKKDGTPGNPCAKAFAYRSHSGYYGIVNSEEAYQNLSRFLFGDVRVDMWIDVEDITLPDKVKAKQDAGQTVNALYQFEVLASPRGKLWYLTRRTAEEDSVACLTHDWWAKTKKAELFVSTVFLANCAKVNPRGRSLAYSLSLGVRVPDYEIDRTLWVNEHYEGGYLFRNALILEMFPPEDAKGKWRWRYAWQDSGVAPPDQEIDATAILQNKIDVRIPFDSTTVPGIKGQIRFLVSAWNPDAKMDE
jgi:hypothetical protein